MLSGQTPYQADTPIGLAFKHIMEPAPHLLDLRPDLPPALDAVIAQAMAKEPAQRFPNASAFLTALEGAVGPNVMLRTRAPEPMATVMPSQPGATVMPASGTLAPPPSAPRLRPAAPPPISSAPPLAAKPAGGLPLMPVLLGGGALAALLVVGVIVFVLLSLINGGGAATATTVARATETVPVIAEVTGTAAPTDPATEAATSQVTEAPTEPATAVPVPSDTAAAPTEAVPPTPAAGAIETSPVDGMAQVFVPAGEFGMGNDSGPADQRPMHIVFLDGYWIDRTEVTNAMYGACVDDAGCTPPQSLGSITRASYFGNPAFANFPVLFVTWPQAQAYCEWAGRRLPTEAEWEKAARGNDLRLYPWGNQAPDATRLNFQGSGVKDTVAVGQFPAGASPFGALDMAGNASEWVADFYDPAYYAASPAENPPGPAQTGCPGGDCRVLRGGNWNSRDEEATATFRLFYGPNDTRDAFTIRCARPAE
jgi:formylglycine-generating enzyme required for sulfatase activity